MEHQGRRFSLDEVQKATDGFNQSRIIGKGGFGEVYKGEVDDGKTVVAVKRTLDPETKQGSGALETEIQLLSKCKHSNLVNLLGYCNENQEMILVYEYMSQGNLADHLYGNKGSSLSWEQRLKICIGVARGLDYLHTGTGLSERIVHLDIKSDNILLDGNWAAKVADLGLSQIGPTNQPNSQVNTVTIRGTPGYMAPEYLTTYTYSTKSDVYSFGVVLLEVLSGTSVWGGQIIPKSDLADWIQHHISKQTLDQIVDPTIVSKIQPGSLKQFVYTASKSLQHDPKRRPSMSEVVALLQSALAPQSSTSIVHGGVLQLAESETSMNISMTEYLDKAINIFGEPIGNNTIVQMGLKPTRENRAQVAYKMMKNDKKYDNALHFVKRLEAKWGNGITTTCMIYNATGETLTLAKSENRYGDIGPTGYPAIILNGQWGAYLHNKTQSLCGSVAAVVYRGKYSDNAFCDRMITWSNRWQRITQGNAAYCEINDVGHFNETNWEAIFHKGKLVGPKNSARWKDCYTMVTIGSETSAIFEAILTHVDVAPTFV